MDHAFQLHPPSRKALTIHTRASAFEPWPPDLIAALDVLDLDVDNWHGLPRGFATGDTTRIEGDCIAGEFTT